MKTVSIHKARSSFSLLIEEAARGEEIVITRAGKPVARLVPIKARPRARRLGLLEGRIRIAADFDDPLPDEVRKRFEGD